MAWKKTGNDPPGYYDDASYAQAVCERTNPLALDPVTVGLTKTLAELLADAGSSINASLKLLTLVPRSAAVVYWAIGKTAGAATALLPASGYSFACDAATAATLRLFSASATVDVFQHG